MGLSNKLSERGKEKLMAYSEVNLSKRDMARRLRRSVVTNFLSQGEKYGKNYKGRSKSKRLSKKSTICLKELLAIPQTVVRH